MAVRIPGAHVLSVGQLATSALTAELGLAGVYNVTSVDEAAALLEHEKQRQGMGCNDDGCLAELAGALGALPGKDRAWPTP